MEKLKACKVCGVEQPLNVYAVVRSKAGKSYQRGECRNCHYVRHLAWRNKNREHIRKQATENMKRLRATWKAEDRDGYLSKQAAYMRKRNAEVKAEVYAAYGGYVCACCGETEPTFLSIDHMNNDGYAHRKTIKSAGKAGNVIYRWLAKQFKQTGKWPIGFQILCMNCQHGKSRNKGICPHQARRND